MDWGGDLSAMICPRTYEKKWKNIPLFLHSLATSTLFLSVPMPNLHGFVTVAGETASPEHKVRYLPHEFLSTQCIVVAQWAAQLTCRIFQHVHPQSNGALPSTSVGGDII